MSNNPHLFNFILRPIEDIVPWGGPGNYNLHWFGLTDGWYWMNVGGIELMRYSQRLVDKLPGWNATLPYFDYQVSRLWEDLLANLPFIIDPLPPDIAAHFSTPERERAMEATAEQWADRYYWNLPPLREASPEQEHEWNRAGNFWKTLFEWWRFSRKLDRGHIAGQHDISIWRVQDVIHFRWRNDCGAEEVTGLPWVNVPDGEHSMPLDRFMGEVQSFHERLMAQMAARVETARTAWPLPEVAIDVEQLQQEHDVRTGQLAAALAEAANRHGDWSAVREAIAEARRLHRDPEATPRRFPWQDRPRPQPQFMGKRPKLVTNPSHERRDEA